MVEKYKGKRLCLAIMLICVIFAAISATAPVVAYGYNDSWNRPGGSGTNLSDWNPSSYISLAQTTEDGMVRDLSYNSISLGENLEIASRGTIVPGKRYFLEVLAGTCFGIGQVNKNPSISGYLKTGGSGSHSSDYISYRSFENDEDIKRSFYSSSGKVSNVFLSGFMVDSRVSVPVLSRLDDEKTSEGNDVIVFTKSPGDLEACLKISAVVGYEY